MRRKYIPRIGVVVAIALIVASIYNGFLLMAEEDRHIDLEHLEPMLQDGDIIFQTSTSAQSKAIQLATKSKYSHMGMIYKKEGKAYVFEAIQPVKLTPVKEWVERGKRKHFVVKRLIDADKILTESVKKDMRLLAEDFLGKNYDIYFEWSDERIYCSELVWKIYKQAANIEIGKLEQLSDFDLTSAPVKQKLKERYGTRIPMGEKVISPAAMIGSNKLRLIYEE
eukprot:TRINITY_DN1867_c0_g1_i1.p2 TRINITY_DN1867_c0_g1~~TRINITY_DN1867_c0_g1_i1.p2  ORF type:complete len:224 (-),score=31.22 TRINITY_DN1867_c0_g1_i1:2746-3417(-)